MAEKVFGYKPGRKTPKVPPQIAGEELERVREFHGTLEAEILVEESRPKDAPLHEEFDWDNKKAGHKWRVHQARNIINVVTIRHLNPAVEEAPAYVNITVGPAVDPEERHYAAIEDVLNDPQQRADLVQRALEKLLRVQREFRHLRELAGIWSAIDAAVESGAVA